MKIAIISDSHDREQRLKDLIKELNSKEIKILIHCGDLCAPFMMKALAEFNGDAHCVFGNTEDRHTSTLLATKRGVNLHGDFGKLEIEGRKIAFIHNDKLGALLAETGKFDIVFHGHNHKAHKEMIKNTLLVNPGEMAGLNGIPTYVIYDTKTGEVEIKELG